VARIPLSLDDSQLLHDDKCYPLMAFGDVIYISQRKLALGIKGGGSLKQ
jgi:hypothetical protein